MSGQGRCSALTAAAEEPLAGSAPTAVGWVGLEQPGPWGAKAWRESRLDPELGAAVEAAAGAHGVRPVLVRAAGRAVGDGSRRLLVAHSRPDAAWLLVGTIDDPRRLLDLDWAGLVSGDRDAVRASLPGLAPETASHLLVCANGKRDACCALLGRPVAAAGAVENPGRVWETTHLSGHRFAPTAVVLPSGWTYGRLGGDDASALLATADHGSVDLDLARGRSAWEPAAQVADLAVRRRAGATGVDDVTAVRRVGSSWVVEHRDGRSWTVTVEQRSTGARRPESCEKAAVLVEPWLATEITELVDRGCPSPRT